MKTPIENLKQLEKALNDPSGDGELVFSHKWLSDLVIASKKSELDKIKNMFMENSSIKKLSFEWEGAIYGMNKLRFGEDAIKAELEAITIVNDIVDKTASQLDEEMRKVAKRKIVPRLLQEYSKAKSSGKVWGSIEEANKLLGKETIDYFKSIVSDLGTISRAKRDLESGRKNTDVNVEKDDRNTSTDIEKVEKAFSNVIGELGIEDQILLADTMFDICQMKERSIASIEQENRLREKALRYYIFSYGLKLAKGWATEKDREQLMLLLEKTGDESKKKLDQSDLYERFSGVFKEADEWFFDKSVGFLPLMKSTVDLFGGRQVEEIIGKKDEELIKAKKELESAVEELIELNDKIYPLKKELDGEDVTNRDRKVSELKRLQRNRVVVTSYIEKAKGPLRVKEDKLRSLKDLSSFSSVEEFDAFMEVVRKLAKEERAESFSGYYMGAVRTDFFKDEKKAMSLGEKAYAVITGLLGVVDKVLQYVLTRSLDSSMDHDEEDESENKSFTL